MIDSAKLISIATSSRFLSLLNWKLPSPPHSHTRPPHNAPVAKQRVQILSDSPSLSCPGAQGTEFNFNPIYILYTHTNTRLHVKWLITMFSLLFLHQLVYCFIFYSLFLLKLLSRLTPPQLLATCKLQPSCWRDLSLFSVKILDLFILFFSLIIFYFTQIWICNELASFNGIRWGITSLSFSSKDFQLHI